MSRGALPAAVTAPPHFHEISAHQHEIMVAVEIGQNGESELIIPAANSFRVSRVAPAPSIALPLEASVDNSLPATDDVRYADTTPRSKKGHCPDLSSPLPPGSAPAVLLFVAIVLIVIFSSRS